MLADAEPDTSLFPRLNHGINDLAHPYPYLIKVLALINNIAEIYTKGSYNLEEALQAAQGSLSTFYIELPADLRFSTNALQAYASLRQGSAFVLLHVSLVAMPQLTPGLAPYVSILSRYILTQFNHSDPSTLAIPSKPRPLSHVTLGTA
jgi:hypothetical protein